MHVVVSDSCDPMNCSPPGSSVPGIFQARILEWVAISFSRQSSLFRDQMLISCVSCTGRWILYHWAIWEAFKWACEFACVCLVAQSCPTLCNLMDYSPPGSSIHGISQARILEWVTISFSRESSQLRDWTHVSCNADRFFTLEPPWKPKNMFSLLKKKRQFIKVWLTYNNLYIFNVYRLMSLELSLLWNYQRSLCHKHIHYLQNFPLTLFKVYF